MSSSIHTRDQAKARARLIRAELQAQNTCISHSAALERVAKEQGFDSWNALSSRLSNEPEIPLQVGDRVAGSYLKQPFDGTVSAVRSLNEGRSFEISISFDEPVDVVEFDSFSNFRHRLHATISSGRISYAKTSDGVPHLVIADVKPVAV
jgi:hypothetical protein